MTRPFRVLVALLVGSALTLFARDSQAQGASKPYVVEYYYKVKWGYTDEWLELYKRNHYPILVKEQEIGRILSMSAATPVYHAGEATRWDFRFTIVWKDAATANDGFDTAPLLKALFPDQDRFKREEQRRFELLLEHTDVPVEVDNLKGWSK